MHWISFRKVLSLLLISVVLLVVNLGICFADNKLTTLTTQEKVVQFVISYGEDAGGHLYVRNLSSTMEIGKTYPITLTFSFEWSDVSNITIDINHIYVGLVSEGNIIETSQGLKALVISKSPEWLGFDYVILNKKVKVGDSITVTAYITPEKTTSSGKAYLMFKMVGSVTGGIPPSTTPISTSIAYSPLALEVKIIPKKTENISQQSKKTGIPGFDIMSEIFAGIIAILLRKRF